MIDIPAVNYPKPWLLFWAVVILSHGYMDYALYRKWISWNRGITQTATTSGRWGRALKIWAAEVFLQRQLFGLSSFRWLIHLLIFFGFLALAFLSLSTFFLKLSHYLGVESSVTHYFLNGSGYIFIKVWGDSFGLALLLGLIIASVRRFLFRPAQQISGQMDVFLLFFLLWLTLSGFMLEGLRLALVPVELARCSFIGCFFIPPGTYTLEELQPWLTLLWVLHSFTGVGILVYLPHSKLLHSILSPLVIAMNAHEEQERKDLYWPDIAKHRATRLPRD
ncbi:MAG TPA: respiratory nitrate reductase subunit gamma [Thermodesulfovibrionales bacterium]|nr:respiratory nitrate reductase subunit gamma [Thermodesulfovibrionales bacterium]